LDDDLSFNSYYSNLKQKVLARLFSIRNIFFLSFSVRLQFLKSFIIPHFDYCASLLIFFNKVIINKLEKLYNRCIATLLVLDVDSMDLEEQQNILIKYNLMPYRYRLFYRFSLFSFKILNHEILSHFFTTHTLFIFQRA
jgi:hypothetical protein